MNAQLCSSGTKEVEKGECYGGREEKGDEEKKQDKIRGVARRRRWSSRKMVEMEKRK
jgi:hypothetical protein